jgi:hypothetical protein
MPEYNKVIEELTALKGEKRGYYFIGNITTREVLEHLELPLNRNNHNRVLNTIRSFYPKSSFGKYSEEEGYVVRVKIRTK